MSWAQYLFSPAVIVFLIPIVAIVCVVVTSLAKKHYKHRERMAMIEQGIHPDYPPDEDTADLMDEVNPLAGKETADFRGRD